MKLIFSSDLHGNLHQYQKLIDYANDEQHQVDGVLIGGDLFLKNKKEGNIDEYSHMENNKGIDKHRTYFMEKILPILKQLKHGKVYVSFGNADLYTDVSFMKEKTRETENIIVSYNEIISTTTNSDDYNNNNKDFNNSATSGTSSGTMPSSIEILNYSSIVFMKGHKKDFERFDTINVEDTLSQNIGDYSIRMRGYTTFDEKTFSEVILNGEYSKPMLEEKPMEDSHFRGIEGFHHFSFDDTNNAEFVKVFSIQRELERIAERYSLTTERCRNQIWICHMPPRDTCCDNISGFHCGSLAVRQFIERYQPMATFHGHFHSSVDSAGGEFCTKIGETLSFTSGNYPKTKHVAIIEFDTENRDSYKRVLI